MSLNLNLELLNKDGEKLSKDIEKVSEFTKFAAKGNKIKLADIDIEKCQECVLIMQTLQRYVTGSERMMNSIGQLNPEPIPSIDFI